MELRNGGSSDWRASLLPALAATSIALVLRFAIDPWVGHNLPYLTFFPAVAFAGYWGGLSAGLITALLGGLLVNFFFVPPRHSLWLASSGDWIGLAGYFAGSVAICLLIRSLAQARRQAHDSAAAQLKFASIVNSAMDAIITVDAHQRIVAFNHAAEQTFACSAAEALGQPIDRFIPERFRDVHASHITAFGRTGVTSRSMYRPGSLWGRRSNGQEFPIEGTISQVETDGQKLFTIILRDVSGRVQAEEALRQSQERLQLAHQAASLGAWEWNIRDGTVVWSEEVCRLHGIPPGAFDGRYESWLATVHPDDRQSAEAAVREALSTGRPYAIEYRTLRPDGSIYWTAARGQFWCDEDGKPERLVGVCMDITDRKAAEDRLRKAERLAAAGQMAATVAHEINNPLASVVNVWYLLSQEPLSSAAKEYLAMGWEQLDRVVHITRQTLAFYREQSQPIYVDVCEAIERVLTLLQAEGALVSTTVRTDFERPCWVASHPDELMQLFSNLLRNAAEAGSSKLIVRASAACGWGSNRRDGVRITMADDGSGIEPEHLKRVFEPFYTTKKAKGTGLGLWVSKAIVEKHEGRIALRSSTRAGRRGTAVLVFLPGANARKPVERTGTGQSSKASAM